MISLLWYNSFVPGSQFGAVLFEKGDFPVRTMLKEAIEIAPNPYQNS